MLAALGIAMVFLVFGLGLGVLVVVMRGARRSAARGPTAEPAPPPSPGLPAKQRSISGELFLQVSDADIEKEIRSGRVVNAIALYREKNHVDAQQARSAVEAWRDRLRAS